MKTKTITLALITVTAGVFAYTHLSAVPQSDMQNSLSALPPIPKTSGNIPAPAAAVEGVPTGSATGGLPGSARPAMPVAWVTIPGGRFAMGVAGGEKDFEDAQPVHEVFIKTFDMSKTLVTVEQYAECVTKGKCTAPETGNYCNWGVEGRWFHPVNCVDWDQANIYAKFKGARLPSESEWEYAAASGGKIQKYPWGDAVPTCAGLAVMSGNGGYGCGNDSTMRVCSKPAGNTAQGLCDMAGNVWQWVQDSYQDSYTGAPADGSAVEGTGTFRVMRGGTFKFDDGRYLRVNYRGGAPVFVDDTIGFRLARSSR